MMYPELGTPEAMKMERGTAVTPLGLTAEQYASVLKGDTDIARFGRMGMNLVSSAIIAQLQQFCADLEAANKRSAP